MKLSLDDEDQYLFLSAHDTPQGIFMVSSDHNCRVDIRLKNRQLNTLIIKPQQLLSPVTFCHYDASQCKLYLGQVFGHVRVYSSKPPYNYISTLKVGDGHTSEQNAILLISTSHEDILVATLHKYYKFCKLNNQFYNVQKWKSQLLSASVFSCPTSGRETFALCFCHMIHPVVLFQPVFEDLIQNYSTIKNCEYTFNENNHLSNKAEEIERQWRMVDVKVNQKYVAALVLNYNGASESKTVNIYSIDEVEAGGDVVAALGHRHLLMSMNTDVQVQGNFILGEMTTETKVLRDFVLGKECLFLVYEDRYKVVSITKRSVLKKDNINEKRHLVRVLEQVCKERRGNKIS